MKTVLIIATVACLAACANSPTPNYDAKFGDAVRQARQAQTLNPNAGATPREVVGVDGRAAHEAQGRYQDSFKAPPPVVNVININNGSGR